MQDKMSTNMTADMSNRWYSLRLGVDKAPTYNGRPRFGNEVSEHLDGLYGYALVISRDRTKAEDLVQETCARAIRAMGRLPEGSRVKSWLFTILRNIWLNQLRKERNAPKVVELDADEGAADMAVETSEDPLASYINKVERERVRQAIQQLPVHLREIILLREYEELSYEEIASVLNRPAGTVMSRLARARSRLRELLLQDRPSLRNRR
jgi:RNA polymerase sigma-70 factor (ECF subfamily)